MLKLYKQICLLKLILLTSLSAGSHELQMNSFFNTFFEGDPYNTWEDPKDERFKHIDLKKFFEAHEGMRKELYDLRQQFIAKYWLMTKEPEADYMQLSREMTKAIKDWIAQYIGKSLPSTVKPSEMAFIGFGSIAREESGPITDLEGAIVFDEYIIHQDTLSRVFAYTLANKLYGLIGHPLYGRKGFRLDEAENAPPHLAPYMTGKTTQEALCMAIKSLPDDTHSKQENSFNKEYYYPYQGAYAYGTTPQRLADYIEGENYEWPAGRNFKVSESSTNKDWYKWGQKFLTSKYIQPEYIEMALGTASCTKDKSQEQRASLAKKLALRRQEVELNVIHSFAEIGRNHVLIYGSEKLYEEFVTRRNALLNAHDKKLRKQLGKKLLEKVATQFGETSVGNRMLITGTLPTVFDLKRHNYRFEEQLLTDLALLNELEEQNTEDIVKELMRKDIFGKEIGKASINRLNQMARLRWKSQIYLNTQLKSRMEFLSKNSHEKKLNELKEQMNKAKAIIEDPKSTAPESLMAKAQIVELKQDIKNMALLLPYTKDSLYNKAEIEYIKNTLIPEQAMMMKRLVAFLGSKTDPEKFPPTKNAFQDDFDPTTVNLAEYGYHEIGTNK